MEGSPTDRYYNTYININLNTYLSGFAKLVLGQYFLHYTQGDFYILTGDNWVIS